MKPATDSEKRKGDAVLPIDAVFLDRDGTLIWDRDYLADPAQVELIPGVQEALARLQRAGVRLYLFTNQSGVARGYFTLETVEVCNRRMIELLGLGMDVFAGTCIAIDPPGSSGGYRKPSPRYIQETVARDGLDARRCYMIGDRHSDWESGLTAGINSVAVSCGKSWSDADHQFLQQHGVAVHPTLAEWVRLSGI